MTPGRAVAALQRLLVAVVLIGAGGYMLVYLYRWEWNRALISGVFFLAAEVGMATSLILRRLGPAGEAHAPAPAPAEPSPLTRLREAGVDRPDPFAWLRPETASTSVFIPVLLGAGAVLSVLAYAVQRVAEATALPASDRALAGGLDTIAPPAEGLLGRRPSTLRRTDLGRTGADRLDVSRGAVLVALTLLAGALGVHVLREAAESRPDRTPLPAATTIQLQVAQRGASSGPEATVRTAEALWVACRVQAGNGDRAVATTQIGPDRVLMVFTPGVGAQRTRRLTGCLSDRTLPLVEARVISVAHIARPQ